MFDVLKTLSSLVKPRFHAAAPAQTPAATKLQSQDIKQGKKQKSSLKYIQSLLLTLMSN